VKKSDGDRVAPWSLSRESKMDAKMATKN